MLFLFKCCFSVFVSWPVIFLLSFSISIILGFSHYALFSFDIISQFLFLSIYQSYRSKSLDCLTDKDGYIISWHTLVCLFHCLFIFLSIWVIFSSFPHPRCRKHSRGILVPKNTVGLRQNSTQNITEEHAFLKETAFDASHRTLLPCPPAVACQSNSGPYRWAGASGSRPIEVSFPVNSNLLGSWIVVARQT